MMNKERIIKVAKKEYESSNGWLYNLFINKENKDYQFIRRVNSTYHLDKEDICVSEDGHYGAICCFGLYFYDLKLKKIIWKIKYFITHRNGIKISIKTKKQEINISYVNSGTKKRATVTVGFDGKVKKKQTTFDLFFAKKDLKREFKLIPEIIYYDEKLEGKIKLHKRERYKLENAPKVNDKNLFFESFAMNHFKNKGYNVIYYERDVGTELCNLSFGGFANYLEIYYYLKEVLDLYIKKRDNKFDFIEVLDHKDHKYVSFSSYIKNNYTYDNPQYKHYLKIFNLLNLLVKHIGHSNLDNFLRVNRLYGKPDLLIYNKKELFFVEVKGYKDQLRETQKIFISASILNNMPKIKVLYVHPLHLNQKHLNPITWSIKEVLNNTLQRREIEKDDLHSPDDIIFT